MSSDHYGTVKSTCFVEGKAKKKVDIITWSPSTMPKKIFGIVPLNVKTHWFNFYDFLAIDEFWVEDISYLLNG